MSSTKKRVFQKEGLELLSFFPDDIFDAFVKVLCQKLEYLRILRTKGTTIPAKPRNSEKKCQISEVLIGSSYNWEDVMSLKPLQ